MVSGIERVMERRAIVMSTRDTSANPGGDPGAASANQRPGLVRLTNERRGQGHHPGAGTPGITSGLQSQVRIIRAVITRTQ